MCHHILIQSHDPVNGNDQITEVEFTTAASTMRIDQNDS